jgi:hypothetical protein
VGSRSLELLRAWALENKALIVLSDAQRARPEVTPNRREVRHRTLKYGARTPRVAISSRPAVTLLAEPEAL